MGEIRISRSIGIGMMLCCSSKIALVTFGGMAVTGGGAMALSEGPMPGIMFSAAAGLLCIALHMIQTRSQAEAKLCLVRAKA
jgi:hypothetical protein